MKAMLLAAGLGTRMGTLSRLRAKPALRILDIPLAAFPLARLSHWGVRQVVVNLHHRPESLRPELERWAAELGLDIRFSVESPVILGTAGGLKLAETLLSGGEGPLLLVNSDSVFWGDLSSALRLHARRASLATMLLQPLPAGRAYGTVLANPDGTVLGIAGRPSSRGPGGEEKMFIGIHILQPELFGHIPGGRELDINANIYPELIGRGLPVHWAAAEGQWVDFGTPRRLLTGTLALLNDAVSGTPSLPLPSPPPGRFCPGGGVSAGEGITGPVYIGHAADIDGSARVHWSSLGEGSRVGRGACLDRSVVMENARVGDGARLTECLVGPGAAVPEDVTAAGAVLTGGQGSADGPFHSAAMTTG